MLAISRKDDAAIIGQPSRVKVVQLRPLTRIAVLRDINDPLAASLHTIDIVIATVKPGAKQEEIGVGIRPMRFA